LVNRRIQDFEIKFWIKSFISTVGTLTKDDKSPYEETDTQDTNDVLSLHGSQSSIQLNEFEKAEIESNVNRISCMEMAHRVSHVFCI
jgi:hypothetical protein